MLEKPRARDPMRRLSLTPFAEIDLTCLSLKKVDSQKRVNNVHLSNKETRTLL